jgi:glycerol-3-phosphate dehydrogenase (NAD(P)+)
LEEAVSSADVLVMAVPSHGFRQVLEEAKPFLRPWVPVVSLAKGLEAGSMLRMSEVAKEVLPGHPVAVLTGPNLASEISVGQPAATVVAIDDAVIATALQELFSSPTFRVYTNPDVVGCEIAGVVKNVIAIASGMAQGMGFGDNTRATDALRRMQEALQRAAELHREPMHHRQAEPGRGIDRADEQRQRLAQSDRQREDQRGAQDHQAGTIVRRVGGVHAENLRVRPRGAGFRS